MNEYSASRLIALAELLFMPMIFYILTQWEKMNSWQSKILWFMIFALVQNEFLSVRTSYRMYTAPLYLLDLLSLIMYVFCIDALANENSVLGYNPIFWIYISVLWAGYAVWDFRMNSLENNDQMKIKYKEWGRLMVLFFIITLLCGLGLILLSNVNNSQTSIFYALYILQLIPFGFILWALTWWIRDLKTILADSKQS
jgi:hypothetical protein